MLHGVKTAAAEAARRAALMTAGTICLAVGAAFVTASVWVSLALAYGPAVASSIVGVFYIGIGLLVMALASLRHRPAAHHAQRPVPGTPPLMQAFLAGLQAGVNSDKRRS